MQITKTKELACKEETRDWVQSSYISNLSFLLHKLRKERSGIDIISKYALQTLECLYGILNANKSSCIYDKGLDAIKSRIITANRPDTFYFPLVATNIEIFNPDSINKLLSDFIQTGLSSSNDDVLRFIFLAKRIQYLNHYSSTLFSSIAKLLMENKKKKRSCIPYLFDAISSLFYNADPYLLKSANLEILLRELLTSYYDVSTTLDMLNSKNIEYGNLLSEYLTDAFGSYACIFYDLSDPQNERNQLVLLYISWQDSFMNCILKLMTMSIDLSEIPQSKTLIIVQE